MISALLAGLGLCLSLIIAPGAQNVFLLKMGIRRQHAIALAVTCFVSDIILIGAGVAGFGVVVEELPWLFELVRWAGVVFLLGYAAAAAWRAVRPQAATIDLSEASEDARAPESLPASASMGSSATGPTATVTLAAPRRAAARATLVPTLLTCLAITWLNPHTYLDTVLLLGSVSAGYGDDRWMFGIGAIIGSAIWFAFLTVAVRVAARWLRSPTSWRVLDGAIAVVMLGLAVSLAAL